MSREFLIFVIVGLMLWISATAAMGENLVTLFEQKNGDVLSYDKDSIKRASGKVEVYVKTIYCKEKQSKLEDNSNNSYNLPDTVEYISFKKLYMK
jgi:hypothetical protein